MSRKDNIRRLMARSAQSTIEYAVLFSIIVGALIAMQVYMKRSVQGQLRSYTEQLSEGLSYSPGATNSLSITITDVIETTHSAPENTASANDITITNTNVTTDQITNRTEEILSFADEPRRW